MMRVRLAVRVALLLAVVWAAATCFRSADGIVVVVLTFFGYHQAAFRTAHDRHDSGGVGGLGEVNDLMPEPWTWRCVPQYTGDSICVKELKTVKSVNTTTLTTCKLTCGYFGALWPRPKTATVGKDVSYFLPNMPGYYTIKAHTVDTPFLVQALEIFYETLNMYHPQYKKGVDVWSKWFSPITHKLYIVIEVKQPPKLRLGLNTDDEMYSLTIRTVELIITATITANTFFGARHGLETLNQLIDYDEEHDSLQIVNAVNINDKPVFTYRGILLDTSRNYYPVESIERTLDAMSYNKLNTFHWHITDSHSFPLVLTSVPNMAYYGAYSARQVYQPEDIRHLVEYGRLRGIRVLPEFDAPAHVGNGWQWGPQQGLGDLAVCVNQEPWQQFCVEPPCGQLNIANEHMYDILGKIYIEIADLFGPMDLFHYGGDEINLNCWNKTQEIVDWMLKYNHSTNLSADDYYKQWAAFQNKAYDLLIAANGGQKIPGILWTSDLTEKGRTNRYLDKNKYIIQIWSSSVDPLIKELLDNGYRVIFSNYDAWYLDCGFGKWTGDGNNWCSPYKGWQKVYDNSPTKIAINLTVLTASLEQILGGEVTLWSEEADSQNLDSRLWPRAAALAERLWSDPDQGWRAAEIRMLHHRERLVRRGIMADQIQPMWCHQNEGRCYE